MINLVLSKFTDFWKEQYNEAFGGGISSSVNHALNPEFINFFGIMVDPAVFTAIIVSAVIIIFAIIIRILVIPQFKKNPKGIQLILEGIVSYFDKNTKEAVHKNVNFIGPYVFTASIYIALATLIELFSLRPSFASINACLSMGIMTFIMINICGFKEKKLKRISRYFNPLNIITDLSVPFSLSLRLFGSILSGYIIMELLYSLIFASFVIPVAVAVITTLLHAFLQAYLFATLTNIFISEAIE